MILIVDSWAWLAIAAEDKISEKVLKHIENQQAELWTTNLNLYEVYYRIKQKSSADEAIQFIELIKTKAKIMNTDEITILAAETHLQEKLAAIDAFVYAAAIKLKGKVLTGDPHFKGKERSIFLE